MIKDVVKVETLDARLEALERHIAQGGIISIVQPIHPVDVIVIAGLSPIQVDAQHTAIETQVELFLARMV